MNRTWGSVWALFCMLFFFVFWMFFTKQILDHLINCFTKCFACWTVPIALVSLIPLEWEKACSFWNSSARTITMFCFAAFFQHLHFKFCTAASYQKVAGLHHANCMPLLYRYPNMKSIRELVYKRGYGKVDKSRIALTDNSIIEKAGSLTVFRSPCGSSACGRTETTWMAYHQGRIRPPKVCCLVL